MLRMWRSVGASNFTLVLKERGHGAQTPALDTSRSRGAASELEVLEAGAQPPVLDLLIQGLIEEM